MANATLLAHKFRANQLLHWRWYSMQQQTEDQNARDEMTDKLSEIESATDRGLVA